MADAKEIKTEQFDILGKKFRAAISFNGKLDRFEANLPAEMAGVIGHRIATGSNMAALRDDFNNRIKEYGIAVASSRKVILCIPETEIERTESNAGTDNDGLRLGAKQMLMVGKVSMKFTVAIETVSGTKREYRDAVANWRIGQPFFHYDGDSPRTLRVIDWTPERESFFRSLIDAMEKLKTRMDGMFGERKAEEIAGLIDKASGNLLGFDVGKGEKAGV